MEISTWSSTNPLVQENYCDALKQVYNETSLKEVDINNFLEVSIASDFIGGGKLLLSWNLF